MADYLYITKKKELVSFVDELLSENNEENDFIAMDTEFISAKGTHRLRLIQIAGKKRNALIDVFSPGIRNSIKYAMIKICSHKVMKVFHAAREDLFIFHQMWKLCPNPFFDTQCAAAALVDDNSIGFQRLGERYGIQISKKQQRSNWGRRNLTEEQKIYALNDVLLLRIIYLKLLEECRSIGREIWLQRPMISWQENMFNRPSRPPNSLPLKLYTEVLQDMSRKANCHYTLIANKYELHQYLKKGKKPSDHRMKKLFWNQLDSLKRGEDVFFIHPENDEKLTLMNLTKKGFNLSQTLDLDVIKFLRISLSFIPSILPEFFLEDFKVNQQFTIKSTDQEIQEWIQKFNSFLSSKACISIGSVGSIKFHDVPGRGNNT